MLDAAARERAQACFALALAEPPADVGALRMSCDSSGSALYQEISGRYDHGRADIAREVERIRDFLDQQQIDSYAAFHLIEAQRRGSPAAVIEPASTGTFG